MTMKLLNLKSILAVGALVLFGAAHASAGSVCPTILTASPYSGQAIAGTTGCDVLFTINADNSVTVTTPSTTPYEFSEDQLIGVVNNSSSGITALNITGPSYLLGFDYDGVCDGSYLSSATCGGGSDSSGYAPAGVSFSNINAAQSSGTVNFLNAIGHGGTAFFSLELAPSAGAGIGGTVGGTTATPEPGGLMLLGSGLFGLLGLARRKVRV
jgi:hypothetical protein